MPYLSASAVVIHYEEALYQVYAPLAVAMSQFVIHLPLFYHFHRPPHIRHFISVMPVIVFHPYIKFEFRRHSRSEDMAHFPSQH